MSPRRRQPRPRRRGRPGPVFKAATWNMKWSVSADRNKPRAQRLINNHGVSVLLLQEAEDPGVALMLRSVGWHVYRPAGGRAVCWDPAVWVALDERRRHVRLARAITRRPGTGAPIITDAPVVALRHRATGKWVRFASYHLPSGVQAGGGRSGHRAGLKVQAQAMATLARLARQGGVHAVCFGGDDNTDESRAPAAWRHMLYPATGLRQITAPKPTHAGGRRIDDFRTRGLETGRGYVLDAPGDHGIHVRTFIG